MYTTRVLALILLLPAAAPAQDEQALMDRLRAQLDVSKREKEQVNDILAAGGLVKRFVARFTENQEMIAKFAPHLVTPKPMGTSARLLGDPEKRALGEAVIFTIENSPVTQAEFDDLVEFLLTYPTIKDEREAATAAILASIHERSGPAVLGDSAKKAKAEIEEIKKQLDAGTSFAELAREFSDDAESAPNGGRRGYLRLDELEVSYAKAISSLRVGQVSSVVATTEGYHLIRVLGTRKGSTPGTDAFQTSHILKRYTDDIQKIADLRLRIASGELDLAFRSTLLRARAPKQFK